MAVLGIQTDKENPSYTINDFCFWIRDYKEYMKTEDGKTMFDNLYPIANAKIFESIFGVDWKQAMSLCIAHMAHLIAMDEQTPHGDTLASVMGGGVPTGVISSASIGSFNKSYDFTLTAINDVEAAYWNQSKYGMRLWSLYKTKYVPTIFVVTPGPLVR